MRAFGRRLVCDQCGGMQITLDDLAHAIGLGEVVTTDGGQGVRPCPRCEREMITTQLRVSKYPIKDAVERCPSDGIWLDGGMLAKLLTVLERKTHGRSRRAGGVRSGSLQQFAHSQAFVADVPGGLNIQRWWERDKPRVHTAYASAHAGKTLACPTCATALQLVGERWPCPGCDGAFVETDALEAMMGEMVHKPWHLPATGGADGARACPVCHAAMQVQQLEGVEVDRCASHGVWFDAGELSAALHHSAPARGWLGRLLNSAASLFGAGDP
jgi:Zn-finger nucleic acid-binding protein